MSAPPVPDVRVREFEKLVRRTVDAWTPAVAEVQRLFEEHASDPSVVVPAASGRPLTMPEEEARRVALQASMGSGPDAQRAAAALKPWVEPRSNASTRYPGTRYVAVSDDFTVSLGDAVLKSLYGKADTKEDVATTVCKTTSEVGAYRVLDAVKAKLYDTHAMAHTGYYHSAEDAVVLSHALSKLPQNQDGTLSVDAREAETLMLVPLKGAEGTRAWNQLPGRGVGRGIPRGDPRHLKRLPKIAPLERALEPWGVPAAAAAAPAAAGAGAAAGAAAGATAISGLGQAAALKRARSEEGEEEEGVAVQEEGADAPSEPQSEGGGGAADPAAELRRKVASLEGVAASASREQLLRPLGLSPPGDDASIEQLIARRAALEARRAPLRSAAETALAAAQQTAASATAAAAAAMDEAGAPSSALLAARAALAQASSTLASTTAGADVSMAPEQAAAAAAGAPGPYCARPTAPRAPALILGGTMRERRRQVR